MNRTKTILVVGSRSVLAQEFAARHPDLEIRMVSHMEVDKPSIYEDIGCVVNFAFAPRFEREAYQPALDIDSRIAVHAERHGLHYVMVSSRRVYSASSQWNAAETDPTPGLDTYGANKARVESELLSRLGSRLTILRPGNVLAYEPVSGRRRFAAYLQSQLVQTGCIRLTVAPESRRDLIPASFFCRVVAHAVRQRTAGIFNVGAGAATEVGHAAQWLIEGYGAGELIAESSQRMDEFQLRSERLSKGLGLSCPAGELRSELHAAGQRLQRERAGART